MFRGSYVALVTPMKKSGEVDYENLRHLVDWHLESKTDGLVLLGTTGEAPTIEPAERVKIINQVSDQVNGRFPIIVGTGTNSTIHTIELTKQAMEMGADGVLLVTPYYNKPTQEGLYQHYAAIAKAVPVPQILYNVPSRTGCDLLPETIARLKPYSNIVAVKEATGSLERLHQLLSLDYLDLLCGVDEINLEFILQGGKGIISVTANIVPEIMHLLCEAALKGERDKAENYDKKIAVLNKQMFVESNPIPVKWALHEMDMIEEGIRLPLTPLNTKFHADLRKALQNAGIVNIN